MAALSEDEFVKLVRCYRRSKVAGRDRLLTWLYAYAALFVRTTLSNTECSDELPSVIFEHFICHLDEMASMNIEDRPGIQLWVASRNAAIDYIRAYKPHKGDVEKYLDEQPIVDNAQLPIFRLIADEARFRTEWALMRSINWFRFPKYRKHYEALVDYWIEYIDELAQPDGVPDEVWYAALYMLRTVVASPDGYIFQRFWPHYAARGA